MAEISTSVADNDLGDQSQFTQGILLELIYIKISRFLQSMPVHVKESSRKIFKVYETLVEMPGLLDLLDQLIRYGLTSLIVLPVHFHHLRFSAPVFHD